MRYIFNGKFLSQNMTGVQRFAYEIILQFDSIVKKDVFFIAIPKTCKMSMNLQNIKKIDSFNTDGILFEQIEFPAYCLKHKLTPINLCNVAPVMKPGIVCIHDLNVFANKKFFSFKFGTWYRFIFRYMSKRAKKLLTVSEFSKKEIMKYLKTGEKEIYVIYNSWEHYRRIEYDEKALEKFDIKEGSYYFSLSSLSPNKNLNWVIRTAILNQNEYFIVAGGINKEIFKSEMQIDIPKNVKLVGYITDSEAKTLMKHSKAFIFPTFYEGFGIPPLEALSTDCDIIVSDNECMNEIYGDEAIYINPNEPVLEMNALLISDNNTNKNLKSKTLERFSWYKSANKLSEIIQKDC